MFPILDAERYQAALCPAADALQAPSALLAVLLVSATAHYQHCQCLLDSANEWLFMATDEAGLLSAVPGSGGSDAVRDRVRNTFRGLASGQQTTVEVHGLRCTVRRHFVW